MEENNHAPHISNLLFAGNYVLKGEGVAIICAVGVHSRKYMTSGQVEKTEFNNKFVLTDSLDYLNVYLGFLANYVGIIFLLGMELRYLLAKSNYIEAGVHTTAHSGYIYLLDNFVCSLCLVLAIMPEALPLAYTYCIA